MYSSMNAVQGLQRDSRTVVFEEHPPAKVMRCSPNSSNMDSCLKECDKLMPDCLDNLVKSSDDNECDVIDCATGVCIVDGLVKLLVCIGLCS